MSDLGASFLVAMTLLITVPTLLAVWLLAPWRALLSRRTSEPPPRLRYVDRAVAGRTPRPMERISRHRSVRPSEPRVARP